MYNFYLINANKLVLQPFYNNVSHLPASVYYVRLIGSNGACSIVEIFERVLN